MNVRWLSLLLLCCLLITVGCRTTEQPPEEPMVPEVPEPPEPKFDIPKPWQPTGRQPWELTESEEDKITEIALNAPEVSEWLESQQQYRILEISWYALWEGGRAHINAEEIDNPRQVIPLLPNEADFYPAVSVIGNGDLQMDIAVDIIAEKAVYISEPYLHPSRWPPKGRIKL